MKPIEITIPSFDAFFSVSVEQPAIFKSFLKQHLPKSLLKLVDLETLRRNDRVNTNPNVKTHRGDSSYNVDFRTGGTLITHLEHQSTPDILMPFRFLQYAGDNILAYFRKHKKTPVILQFLLYHGEQSPYPYQTSLQGYYSFYPEWGKKQLTLRFHLIDLTQLSDKEILKHGHCALLELLLKHGRDGKFELDAAAYRSVFKKCVSAVGQWYISAILTYIASLEKSVGKKIYQFLEEVCTNKQGIIMTYGEQLRQEGRQEEKVGIARNMLHQLQLGLEVVQQATGLSRQELASL